MRGSDSGVVGGEPPEGFHLDVRAHGFAMTDAIRTYATDHVAGRLAKHARDIQTMVVRFDDVNGTKGGADKLCEVEVTLRRLNPIVVRELDDDLRAAMARAADRTEQAVGRTLARRRDTSRQRGHKLVRQRKTMT